MLHFSTDDQSDSFKGKEADMAQKLVDEPRMWKGDKGEFSLFKDSIFRFHDVNEQVGFVGLGIMGVSNVYSPRR